MPEQRPPWHGWYSLAVWRKRRAHQLAIEPLCRMCLATGQVTAATVADHVKPHRGDTDLFWHGELQSLCKLCHDRFKQSQEAGGTKYLMGCDETGEPVFFEW